MIRCRSRHWLTSNSYATVGQIPWGGCTVAGSGIDATGSDKRLTLIAWRPESIGVRAAISSVHVFHLNNEIAGTYR